MDGVVLVLNQNYEPLNVCNLPRAFRLVFGEKAEVIEYDHQMVRTPRTEFRAPSVIRLQYLIRRPRPRAKLSRREVFARDRHTCQYCGRQTHDLTLDHVMPRHRGGAHSWENLVTACKPCNHRKGGKTIEEARLRLSREPPDVDRAARSRRPPSPWRCRPGRRPMPGQVIAAHARADDGVESGDPLVTIEAMKVEHVVAAPVAGRVAELVVRPADQVSRGQVLAVIEP